MLYISALVLTIVSLMSLLFCTIYRMLFMVWAICMSVVIFHCIIDDPTDLIYDSNYCYEIFQFYVYSVIFSLINHFSWFHAKKAFAEIDDTILEFKGK